MHHFITAEGDGAVTSSAFPNAGASVTFGPGNPFYEPSTLPFQAPPFDKISDSDYQPAIEAGMAQQLAEIQAIAENPDQPTFANTLAAIEKSGRLLDRVMSVFDAVTSANTNPDLQTVQQIEAPKLAAHHDAIYLDSRLYHRVKEIYKRARRARAGCRITAPGRVLPSRVRARRGQPLGSGQNRTQKDQ